MDKAVMVTTMEVEIQSTTTIKDSKHNKTTRDIWIVDLNVGTVERKDTDASNAPREADMNSLTQQYQIALQLHPASAHMETNNMNNKPMTMNMMTGPTQQWTRRLEN
jgi:hypothetical protein